MAKPLSQLNANQISEKWAVFLRDCAAHGDTVVYEETKTTGGTFDPVKDKTVGGTSSTVSTSYQKASLEAPISFNESTTSDRGGGFVMGHQLGSITAGESMVTRFKSEIPLTKTGVYLINGQRWKFVRLIDAYRIGKRVFWNLVQLARA